MCELPPPKAEKDQEQHENGRYFMAFRRTTTAHHGSVGGGELLWLQTSSFRETPTHVVWRSVLNVTDIGTGKTRRHDANAGIFRRFCLSADGDTLLFYDNNRNSIMAHLATRE